MKYKTTCRLCDSAALARAPKLSPLPLVDRYSREPNTEPLHPCALQMCRECGHIQLAEIVEPELLFGGEYLFRTGDYPWLVAHYREYADAAFREFAPQNVFEIGCNDGTLLKMFEDKGCHVAGADPSSVPCSVSYMNICFTSHIAKFMPWKADLLLANHVFAHNNDLEDIVHGVKILLAKDGVFIFETNSGLDLLERHLFDIVYHEHMDYHTVAPLVQFFDRLGLQLFRVEHNESKGGTLKGYVSHKDARPIEPSVRIAMELEAAHGVGRPEVFQHWMALLDARKSAVHKALAGRKFIGYGAAAGGIATLHHLGLASECLWLVDDSPRRHGMYAPHSNLVVKPTDTLYHYETHHGMTKIVVLSWRYAQKIQAKHPQLEMIVP